MVNWSRCKAGLYSIDVAETFRSRRQAVPLQPRIVKKIVAAIISFDTAVVLVPFTWCERSFPSRWMDTYSTASNVSTVTHMSYQEFHSFDNLVLFALCFVSFTLLRVVNRVSVRVTNFKARKLLLQLLSVSTCILVASLQSGRKKRNRKLEILLWGRCFE